MAAPTSLQTFPANSDIGIPVGESITIVFDRGVDLLTAKNHVVLYGDDSDKTSGPDSALWLDVETGNNPYFLRSPGFKGLVELSARLVYVDLASAPTYTEVAAGVITSEADELAYGTAGAGHKLILTPREPLAADVLYTLHVLGDPDAVSAGVSSRTIFDVVPDVGNSGTTGLMSTNDSYTGMIPDTVVLEFTTGGNIGTAIYKWYYLGAGVGSAVSGVMTSRRFRRLTNGLQVNFSGTAFVAGDIYRFNVEAPERMATSFQLSFTTNDGTYTSAPTSPSTPAASTPPSSVIPPAPGASSATRLTVLEMTPSDGSYYNTTNTRQIVIEFSDVLDTTTITDSTVNLFRYPVSGQYQLQSEVVELEKILTVSGSTLTIDI